MQYSNETGRKNKRKKLPSEGREGQKEEAQVWQWQQIYLLDSFWKLSLGHAHTIDQNSDSNK